MKRRLPVVLATSAFLLMSCNATKDKSKVKSDPVNKKKKETKVVDNKTSVVDDKFVAACDEAVFNVAPSYILKKTTEMDVEIEESEKVAVELIDTEVSDFNSEVEVDNIEDEINPINISLKFQNNQDNVDLEKLYELNGLSLDPGRESTINMQAIGIQPISAEGEEYHLVISSNDQIDSDILSEIDFKNLEFNSLEVKDLDLTRGQKEFLEDEVVQNAIDGTRLAKIKIENEHYEIGLKVREECAGNVEEQIKLAIEEDDRQFAERVAQIKAENEEKARIKAEEEAARVEAERKEAERVAAEKAEAERKEAERVDAEKKEAERLRQLEIQKEEQRIANEKREEAHKKALEVLLAQKKAEAVEKAKREQKAKEEAEITRRANEELVKEQARKAEEQKEIELKAQEELKRLEALREEAKTYSAPFGIGQMEKIYDSKDGILPYLKTDSISQKVEKHREIMPLVEEYKAEQEEKARLTRIANQEKARKAREANQKAAKAQLDAKIARQQQEARDQANKLAEEGRLDRLAKERAKELEEEKKAQEERRKRQVELDRQLKAEREAKAKAEKERKAKEEADRKEKLGCAYIWLKL